MSTYEIKIADLFSNYNTGRKDINRTIQDICEIWFMDNWIEKKNIYDFESIKSECIKLLSKSTKMSIEQIIKILTAENAISSRINSDLDSTICNCYSDATRYAMERKYEKDVENWIEKIKQDENVLSVKYQNYYNYKTQIMEYLYDCNFLEIETTEEIEYGSYFTENYQFDSSDYSYELPEDEDIYSIFSDLEEISIELKNYKKSIEKHIETLKSEI